MHAYYNIGPIELITSIAHVPINSIIGNEVLRQRYEEIKKTDYVDETKAVGIGYGYLYDVVKA